MEQKTRRGIELMARTGFVAKGVVYLLLGVLAFRAAGAGSVGPANAVALAVLEAPMGRMLLAILGIGLAWYAVWRFMECFADANNKGSEPKGLGARAIYLVSGIIYASIALDAFALLLRWDNDKGQIRSIAASLLDGPLAIAAGLGVAAYGLWQLRKGIVGKLSKQLNAGEARRETGKWVIALSRVGLAGRGLVFVLVGYWLVTHPATAPSMASSSSGAVGALKLFERLPQANALLLLSAVALAAYGVYQLVHSRYRRINVPG